MQIKANAFQQKLEKSNGYKVVKRREAQRLMSVFTLGSKVVTGDEAVDL